LADERICGELLMRLRQDAGLTRAEVARRVAVWDSASVGAWERGMQQPSPAKIPLLAAALGVKPLDLFAITDAPSLSVLRRAAGLTLTELASRAAMSYTKCRRLEKGLLDPTGDDERRLAASLSVRLKDVRAAVRARHAAAAMRNPTTRPGP
jgi:transcriptional regulator with XRE-family HTH domain